MFPSKFKLHCVVIPELFQMLFHHLFKWRRPAVQYEGLRPRSWKSFLQHFFSDESYALLPVLRRVWLHVYCQKELEFIWVLFFKSQELVFQQDIVCRSISEHQGVRSAIVVLQTCLENLVAWSDSCSAWDQADFCLAGHWLLGDVEITITFVKESSFGTFHQHVVSNFHVVYVLAHKAALWEFRMNIREVNLQKNIDITSLSHHANRSVFSLNHLAIDFCAKYNMLADWKSKRMLFILECKSIDMSVFRDLDLFGKL